MKTGLSIGVPVAAALIGVAWLAAWPAKEVPPATAAKFPLDRSTLAPESATCPATRTELPGASPAADDREEAFPLGEQVRQALASDDPAVRASVFRRGLRRWVRVHPEEAASYAETITDDPLREEVLRVVAQTWSQRDPEKAVAWAAALPDGIERRVNLGAVCIGLAGVDSAKAVQWADDLGLRDDGVLADLTSQWAARDEAAALAWVSGRPAGLERDQLMQRIAFAEAQSDPVRAARFAAEQISAGSEQTEAIITVVNQWAQRDPSGASAWVANFPPGAMRERALSELRGQMVAR